MYECTFNTNKFFCIFDQVDIQAADGGGEAVTGVTFWDGNNGDLHLYNHVEVPDEECSCCLSNPVPVSLKH